MKRYLDQLKPAERRVVVGVAFAFFVVLNYIFVWPYFSDYGKASARMLKAQDTLVRYRAELVHKPEYEKKIKALESGGGAEVLPEDQAIDLVHYYSSRASSSGVQVLGNSRLITRTNDQFFVDHEMQLTVQAKESQLVNFLYSLGAGNSTVRVRALTLRPDQSHQQLSATISIVASYQKKPAARPVAAAAKLETPGSNPVAHTNKPLISISKTTVATNKPGLPNR